ncbi:MAG TPA: DUF3883 domain-containing protein, partial [Verrucomicrobiota bacterium]|nr:DUF3883 domain-containing protein [Verrucomicrobiota bacterium]
PPQPPQPKWKPECEPDFVVQIEEYKGKKKPDPNIFGGTSGGSGNNTTGETSFSHKKEDDNLPDDDRKNIGRWGEKLVFNSLKDKFKDKTITWLNEKKEEGESYDITITKDDTNEYVEVKTTITDKEDWFTVSNAQWQVMKEKADKFHIYRVYNAGTKNAKIIEISNPYEKWNNGEIIADPIRIKI